MSAVTNITPHPWWEGAVVYQVYPRSFADADGDGIGDLRGVLAHLDYLADLGVDAIWLSPFFRSPMADNGYDISDHMAVDPVFGSMLDAQALITAAHQRGMKVILDAVLAHTSIEHPWFTQSRSSRDDPRRDWYVWADGVGDGPPNGWLSGLPAGSRAWTFDEPTGQWYLHSHLPEQPDLNWDNPAVEEAMAGILRFWLAQGVDGFRLDAINRIGKDPELRDNLPGEQRQQNWPSIHPRLQRLRRVVDQFEERMVVGEVWLFGVPDLVAYLRPGELNLAHDFMFPRLPFSAAAYAEHIRALTEAGPDAWFSWFLSNHDEPRAASRFDEDGRGLERAELLSLLLLSLRGTAFLYQGEELGLRNSAAFDDPNGRDVSRAPMPWAPPSRAGAGAGFTTGIPWLPLPDEAEARNAETLSADADSTLAYHRAVIRERKASTALTHGDQQVRALGDVLVIDRWQEQDRRVVLLNLSMSPAVVPRSALGLDAAHVTTRLSTVRDRPMYGAELPAGDIGLHPLEGLLLRAESSCHGKVFGPPGAGPAE